MEANSLIYEWNTAGPVLTHIEKTIELNDETLRDGLQSSSIQDPSLEDKVSLLHLMDSLGIHSANVGLPGAGPGAVRSADTLVGEIASAKLRIQPNCAARTVIQDIKPIVDISRRHGVPVFAYLFLGSSPIRMAVENWDLKKLISIARPAIEFAVREGLPVSFVTEDTTRSDPDTLRPLFLEALEAGATRLCLCDTAGYASPSGVSNVVRFARDVVRESGRDVGLDWHGHSDRGLSLINALTAAAEGVTRIHGTALGVGERVGNTPMDQLLVNLKLFGAIDTDLTRLPEYVDLVHRSMGAPLPDNYPMVGKDAFRTATGVHAAAIIKAQTKNDNWLVDRVYSGVPAGWLGRKQHIEVGPMSGASNAKYWLEQEGITPDPALVEAILDVAKRSDHLLTREELLAVVHPAGTDELAKK